MLRLLRLFRNNEKAQALPLFGLMIFVLLGFVAMSIDVGRYVWARTSMQAGVDAAALAAAQSMPIQANADAKATEYWLDNSGFIQSQGTNVQFTVSYPPGNKAIKIEGAADIPTWFAKFFGVNSWHVSAEGQAESQVLDIAVVLDISGSMCYDPPIIHTESSESNLTGPGHFSPASARPVIQDGNYTGSGDSSNDPMPSGGGNTITIKLNSGASMSQFSTNDRIVIHSGLNGSGTYEIFKITSVSSANHTLTLSRSQTNSFTSQPTSKISHPVGAEIWQTWSNNCANAVRNSSAPYGAEPFDGTIASAEYFTTLFNPSYDKIGIATYSTTATNVQSLSSNLTSVKNQIHNINPPSGSTNIAHGLATGQKILDGTGKRANAVRVIVLLTDGIPNYYCTNSSAYTGGSSCSTGSSATSPTSCSPPTTAMQHAWDRATAAQAADTIVFVIGLGDGVLDCVLQKIADNGGGMYYKAPTPAQLDAAFQAIAEQTHIALVK